MRSRPLLSLSAKFAGAFFCAALALWLASGALLAWSDPEKANGANELFAAPPLELAARTYAAPGGVIAKSNAAHSVELFILGDTPVYRVEGADGPALFHARTASKMSPLPKHAIRSIARSAYIGEGELEEIDLLAAAYEEYQGPLPVWRVAFDDPMQTYIYISPDTGDILAWRNRHWRWRETLKEVHEFSWLGEGAAAARGVAFIAMLAALGAIGGVAWRRFGRRGP